MVDDRRAEELDPIERILANISRWRVDADEQFVVPTTIVLE